jgi:hypothetical protein
VGRGEDGGRAGPPLRHLADEPVEGGGVDGRRVGQHPRRGQFEDVGDARQDVRRPAAVWADGQQDRVPVSHGPDGGPGEQHVPGVVQPCDQHGPVAVVAGRTGAEDVAVHRLGQVGGHVGRLGYLLRPRHLVGDQHAPGAGSLRRGHVGRGVTHHEAAGRVDAEPGGSRPDHARPRLAAPAPVALAVGAVLHRLERPQQLLDAGVDPGEVGLGEEAPGDAALVGHDPHGDAGGAQPAEHLGGARDGADACGIAVVRDVHDQGAVTVEKDGVDRSATVLGGATGGHHRRAASQALLRQTVVCEKRDHRCGMSTSPVERTCSIPRFSC